jgi:hypothetical protein
MQSVGFTSGRMHGRAGTTGGGDGVLSLTEPAWAPTWRPRLGRDRVRLDWRGAALWERRKTAAKKNDEGAASSKLCVMTEEQRASQNASWSFSGLGRTEERQ